MWTKIRFSLFCVMLVGAIAACGGSDVPAAPTVVPTTATATTAPTAVPATATSVPTAPPPLVATAVPTDTPEPAAEEPAADEVALYGADDFGDNRNPLTGERVDDPAVLDRRPLAVKISNAPPSYVRPQSGLNAADIVYEHATEGALTRFTMLVYSDAPERMGPIRSARLIDVELPAMYDAALAFSGAGIGVNRKLYASDFSQRIIGSGEQGYYRTGEDKPYEHTFYARPEGLWQALEAKSQNRAPQFGSYMAFTSQPPPGDTTVNEITLDYRWEQVVWTYDADTNMYYRTADGDPHRDGNTGEQVRARNVVVPMVVHVDDANICEEIRDGKCVALSVEIQLWGRGEVLVFRDGRQYRGTWVRENRNDMLTFIDAAGNPIPLQIGNSWISVMPTNYPPLQTE